MKKLFLFFTLLSITCVIAQTTPAPFELQDGSAKNFIIRTNPFMRMWDMQDYTNWEIEVMLQTQDDLPDGTTYKKYPATDKTKLAGIASGAEVNVQADWNAVSGDALILNKPTIPTVTTFYGTSFTKEFSDYVDTSTGTATFNISAASFSSISNIQVTAELSSGGVGNSPIPSVTSKSTSSITITLLESKNTGVLVGGNIEGLETHATAGTRVYITVRGN